MAKNNGNEIKVDEESVQIKKYLMEIKALIKQEEELMAQKKALEEENASKEALNKINSELKILEERALKLQGKALAEPIEKLRGELKEKLDPRIKTLKERYDNIEHQLDKVSRKTEKTNKKMKKANFITRPILKMRANMQNRKFSRLVDKKQLIYGSIAEKKAEVEQKESYKEEEKRQTSEKEGKIKKIIASVMNVNELLNGENEEKSIQDTKIESNADLKKAPMSEYEKPVIPEVQLKLENNSKNVEETKYHEYIEGELNRRQNGNSQENSEANAPSQEEIARQLKEKNAERVKDITAEINAVRQQQDREQFSGDNKANTIQQNKHLNGDEIDEVDTPNLPVPQKSNFKSKFRIALENFKKAWREVLQELGINKKKESKEQINNYRYNVPEQPKSKFEEFKGTVKYDKIDWENQPNNITKKEVLNDKEPPLYVPPTPGSTSRTQTEKPNDAERA